MTRLSACALAVVAAAFSTALRTLGSSQLAAAAAALAAARRAAAAAFSGELPPVALVPLCRGLVGLIAGTGPVVAEVAAAVVERPVPMALVPLARFTVGLTGESLRVTD